MTEMLTGSWDNQGWPGEGQQETQHPTAWSGAPRDEAGRGVLPGGPAKCSAPKISCIIPLQPCVPMSQPGHWLLKWVSWDVKEPAPKGTRGDEPLPYPVHPTPPLGSYF